MYGKVNDKIMMNKEQKDNRFEAEFLIDYARSVNKENILLSALDAMLNDQSLEKIKDWDWNIAEIIQARTAYISIDMDTDVEYGTGEWGTPEVIGGHANPIGISVNDRYNLAVLRQEVDDIINKANDKILTFIATSNKPRWKCLSCDRFLGKELSSFEEVSKLLRNFSIGKYWNCRSCGLPNYFIIDESGIEFKISKLDFKN